MPGQFECRICWYVYNPTTGDPIWQIPAGTTFEDLPGVWRCPDCDADKSHFLPIEEVDRDA